MEEKEKAIPFWYQICREMTIFKKWDDVELGDLFKELENHRINRSQFKKMMNNQIKQVEKELKVRKQKYEISRRAVSTPYDNWVKCIPSTHKHLVFELRQSETKKFIIEDMMKM